MKEGRRGAKKEGKNSNKKKNRLLVIILMLAIIITGTLLAIKIFNRPEEVTELAGREESKPEENINIFSGNDRPIAVMIDNNTNAWPHSSLEKAYIVYEIIVEGGETRLMALFKGQDLDKIGPIRSSRHYFLDYVLENDAIYVHFGWSPQAESQIPSLGINNINGLNYDSGKSRDDSDRFWRESKKSAPHNAYINTEKIAKIAEKLGYKTTSDKDSVLNYVADEVNLEDGISAETISIPYSGTSNVIKYEYNAVNKVYEKYSKGKKQVAEGSGETLTTKNIIITFAENDNMNDGTSKGRQDLHNIGSLDGYYITNGKAIKIKCEKASRGEQTVYKDLEGNEIKVNDGNTYIQICPIDSKVTITPGTVDAPENTNI